MIGTYNVPLALSILTIGMYYPYFVILLVLIFHACALDKIDTTNIGSRIGPPLKKKKYNSKR